MARYHLSPKTGEPMTCRANNICPFADASEHYETLGEARAAFERKMAANVLPSYEKGKILISPLDKDMRVSPSIVVVPRGTYVLADPFSIVGSDPESWEKWKYVMTQESGGFGQAPLVGAQYNGYPIIAMKTLHGGGTYKDSMDREYNLEHGVVGLVPFNLARHMGIPAKTLEDNGNLVSFVDDAYIEYDEGRMLLGEELYLKSLPFSSEEEDSEDLFADGYVEPDEKDFEIEDADGYAESIAREFESAEDDFGNDIDSDLLNERAHPRNFED